MRKKQILITAIALTLLLIISGCTTGPMRQRTQTRLDGTNDNEYWMDRNNDLNQGFDRDQRNLVGNNNNIFDNELNDNNLGRNNNGANNLNQGNNLNNNNQNDDNNTSRRIENEINKINGVRDSVVLLRDDSAVIAVDLDNNTNNNRNNNQINSRIRSIVRDMANNIDDVRVTTDRNIRTRLSTIVDDIGTGRPIREFANELDDLFRDIMPIR